MVLRWHGQASPCCSGRCCGAAVDSPRNTVSCKQKEPKRGGGSGEGGRVGPAALVSRVLLCKFRRAGCAFVWVFFVVFIKKNYSRKVSLRSGATGCEVPKATVSPGAPEARGRPRSAPQGERGTKDTEEIYRAECTQETALAPLARERNQPQVQCHRKK